MPRAQEQLPLPAWCAWDEDAASQQRRLSCLVHGRDRWARAAHAALLLPSPSSPSTSSSSSSVAAPSFAGAGSSSPSSWGGAGDEADAQLRLGFLEEAARQLAGLLSQLEAAAAAGGEAGQAGGGGGGAGSGASVAAAARKLPGPRPGGAAAALAAATSLAAATQAGGAVGDPAALGRALLVSPGGFSLQVLLVRGQWEVGIHC